MMFCLRTHFILKTFYLLLCYLLQDITLAKKIKVSVPITPVRQGGLLSVYCQIWDLAAGEEVTLFRRPRGQSDIERLTWNGGYAEGVEERVFIAQRHVSDGSLVYFLTITNVVREDEGDYTCTVFRSDSMETLAYETLPIDVFYFPDDPQTDPLCSGSQEPITASEGDIIVFNCSSHEGLPVVQLAWSKGGGKSIAPTRYEHKNGMVFNEVHYKITRHDNGAVFVCELTSSEFPDETKSCHVGPIKVLFTQSAPGDIPDIPDIPIREKDAVTVRSPGVVHNNNINNKGHDLDNKRRPSSSDGVSNFCKKECSLLDSPAFSWIVLTTITGSVAFLFFVIGLVLFVKLRMFNENHKRRAIALKYAPKSPLRNDIYEELESRRCGGEPRMYMALHLADNPGKHPVQCGDLVIEKTNQTCSS